MKAKDVIGRRIVAVQQELVNPGTAGAPPVHDLKGIELDNGAVVYASVTEGADGYFIRTGVTKPTKRPPRQPAMSKAVRDLLTQIERDLTRMAADRPRVEDLLAEHLRRRAGEIRKHLGRKA